MLKQHWQNHVRIIIANCKLNNIHTVSIVLTPDPKHLQSCEGLPAVPEQGSGERVVFPDATASSPLPLNGNRVNPLKVHPSAAVTRQSRAGR